MPKVEETHTQFLSTPPSRSVTQCLRKQDSLEITANSRGQRQTFLQNLSLSVFCGYFRNTDKPRTTARY